MKIKAEVCYLINLINKDLKIRELKGKKLQNILEDSNVKDPRKLTNYDRRVFLTMPEAEKFLKSYKKILNGLNSKTCKKKGITAILYKRRYIILSLMREKNQTVRNKPRVNMMMSKVKIGEMFNLYDQTNMLTVILTKR